MTTPLATFQETLSSVLLDDALHGADPAGTVRPGPPPPTQEIRVDEGLGAFGDTLGEGGMGVIRVATQRALERPVAVKSLKRANPSPGAVRHLLHEAHVAGLLDHPNVVPIHDIIIDDQGLPHIVMKRVEGRPWSHWARDREGVRDRLGVTDTLAWQLGVFLQVCNAVAYAHDRGILHRDLKLDNVMIGTFGEVLVLDWGIAVALDDRYGDRLPKVVDQKRVAGTPRYMAPEMALADGPAQGVHTDVYLLGGMLHHVLAGRPPHRGASVQEVLRGIPDSRPEIPDRVPGALRRIVERALQFEPTDRYPNVRALQQDVQAFLDHRGSVRLTRRAGRSLAALREAVGEEGSERATLHRLYDEARFGFEHALAEWPENTVARDGLDEARVALARWELDQDEPGTAAALLDSVAHPPAELVARARLGFARRQATRAELDALRADADPRIGRRTRLFVMGLIAIFWVVMPLTYAWFQPVFSWWQLLWSSVVLLASAAALAIWARDSLSRTQLNRVSMGAVLFMPLCHVALDLTCMALGVPTSVSVSLHPVLWFVLTGMVAITVIPPLWMASVGYAVAAVVGALWPWTLPWAVSVANVLLLVTAVLWGSRWVESR